MIKNKLDYIYTFILLLLIIIVSFALFLKLWQRPETEYPEEKEIYFNSINELISNNKKNEENIIKNRIWTWILTPEERWFIFNTKAENCQYLESLWDRLWCVNYYKKNLFKELTDSKWIIAKKTCELAEKEFWKEDEITKRCYFIYWTTLWLLYRNTSYCDWLSWDNKGELNISNWSVERMTKESCNFFVKYGIFWIDAYLWMYLSKVKESNEKNKSIIYQKTMVKFWEYHKIKQDYETPVYYDFEIWENLNNQYKDFLKIKALLNESKEKFYHF